MSYQILIVDDSRTVRRMIERTIGLAGVPVAGIAQAENGQEALRCIEDQAFDLVLTDLNMPVMDGMELVRTLSARGWMRDLIVIVVTTEGSDERIRQLQRYGIRGFLRKPVTPEDIKTVLDSILEVRDD